MLTQFKGLLAIGGPNGLFFGLGKVSKTVLGASLKDKIVLISVPRSIITFLT